MCADAAAATTAAKHVFFVANGKLISFAIYFVHFNSLGVRW